MKIGNVVTKNNIFLAPMAGVSEVAFRSLCSQYGAGLTYTEMISVKGLYYNSKNTIKMLQRGEEEKLCAVQLFGHEPEIFKSVIQSGVLDKFDIIDINMGCLAPKIVKNGDGSALLSNLSLAKEIIKTCVSVSKKPVTVKFRMGVKAGEDISVEFAKMCEEAGASAITLHPRTRQAGYSGKIDLMALKAVKNAVKIPVIASGDVVDKQTLDGVLSTGVDGVMIGRATVGHPNIFAELQGQNVDLDKKIIAKKHLDMLKKYYSEERVILNLFKRHAMKYVSLDKKGVALAQSLKEIEQILGI